MQPDTNSSISSLQPNNSPIIPNRAQVKAAQEDINATQDTQTIPQPKIYNPLPTSEDINPVVVPTTPQVPTIKRTTNFVRDPATITAPSPKIPVTPVNPVSTAPAMPQAPSANPQIKSATPQPQTAAPAQAPTQVPALKPIPTPTQAPTPAQVIKPETDVKPLPPMIHPPLMWEETQGLLGKIRAKLDGEVVSYFTTGSIVGDDVKYFYAHLRDVGFQDKLYFILVSDGGDGKSAYRIASLLKSFCNQLVIVIPERAASAATMLSLAGDEIIMTPLSYLTAVDTSMVHPLNPKDRDNNPARVEIEEVKRAVEVLLQGKDDAKDNMEIYKTIFNYIHPVAFGAMERTSNLSEMLCRDILELRKEPLSKEVADKLIDTLNRYFPAHSYPITASKARALGLKVVDSDNELNQLLWAYLNINRYISEPYRTDINESAFHSEKVLNIIESGGRRFFVRNTVDRRLDPIIKGWTTLRDEYKWFSVSEADENGKKSVKVSTVEF